LCIAADLRMYAGKRAARERNRPASLLPDASQSIAQDSGMQLAE